MKNNYFDKYIRERKTFQKDFSKIKNELNLTHEVVTPSKKTKYVLRICLTCMLIVLCFHIAIIHEFNKNMFCEAPTSDELFTLYNRSDASQDLDNQVNDSIDLKVGFSTSIIVKTKTIMDSITYSVNDQACLRINENGELTALKTSDKELYITVECKDIYGNKSQKIIYINVIE